MKKFFKITGFILILIFFVGMMIILSFVMNIYVDKENTTFDINKILEPITTLNYEIYTNENELIANENKDYVTLNNINDYTKNAFISIEDKEFYKHNGVNLKRILKASINNIVNGSFKEGASTISQQLIKNTHLTNEKTLSRKAKEIIITKKMEQTLTKDEILEYYLNIIYFGNNAYGISTASQDYFNKEVKDLTISESAVLAGIIKAPVTYSPYTNYNKCMQRRNLVLREMFKDKYISQHDFDIALKEEIKVYNNDTAKIDKNTSLYEKMAVREACEILNVPFNEISDYKIYTYKDSFESYIIEKNINDDIFYEKNKYGNIPSGMAIVINSETGGVEAISGRSDYKLENVMRQPGSAIKPILVYAPALNEKIISPATKILDEKINIDGYSPKNVGGFHGYVSVRDSVSKSLNIPAIKIMEKVGIEKCKQFAEKANIKFDKLDTNYAIALGGFTKGVTLKDLTTSYIPFVNLGKYSNSTFIKEIKNKNGVTIYKHKKEEKQIMDEDASYLMTDLLMSGVKNGTSKRLSTLPFEVAGKTGTVAVENTNQNSDAISIAYTSNKIMGVWLGNYTMEEKDRLESTNNGGTYATDIIKETFMEIYKNNFPDNFEIPSGIQTIELDTKSYENNAIEIASKNTPDRYKMSELFSEKNLPQKISKNFTEYTLDINKVSAVVKDNLLKVTLPVKDYISYKICLYSNNKEYILDEIECKNGEYNNEYNISLYDNNPIFYVKYYYNNGKNIQITEKIKLRYDNMQSIKNIANNSAYLWQ